MRKYTVLTFGILGSIALAAPAEAASQPFAGTWSAADSSATSYGNGRGGSTPAIVTGVQLEVARNGAYRMMTLRQSYQNGCTLQIVQTEQGTVTVSGNRAKFAGTSLVSESKNNCGGNQRETGRGKPPPSTGPSIARAGLGI